MGSFLEAQIGFGVESTYGTRVAPTLFLPLLSETLKLDKGYIQSKSYRAGRTYPVLRRPGLQRVSGQIKMELQPQGMSLILKHMLGSVSTSGAGPYVHTVTPAALNGLSLSAQIVMNDRSGTNRMRDYSGLKIVSWEIGCNVGEFATLTLDVDGQKEDTTQTAATASYPANQLPFSFVEGALTVAGTSTPCKAFSMKGENGLGVGVGQIGSVYVREPVIQDIRQITGTLDTDFSDYVNYLKFVNQTAATLVLTLTQASGHTLAITSAVEFDGDTPNAAGAGEEIRQNLNYVGVHATSDASVVTMVLTNADATP